MSLAPQSVAYKESGIPWVGKIPEHWEMRRVKHIARKIIGGGTPDTSVSSHWATEKKDSYLWVSIEDITKSNFIRDTKKYITKSGLESSSAKIIPPFSILYSIYASLGKIAYSDLPVTTNQAILAIQPQDNLFYKFLFYFLHSTTRDIITLSSMTTQNNISLFVVQNLKIPLPPLEEQKKIADFLDKKTHQIEEFINKKQKLITLLEEKKQTLINQCVTQGLDSSASLKDSGVEWLGKIPTHWEVRRLASFGSFSKGGNISRGDLSESGNSVILYGDIYTKYEIKTSNLKSKVAKDLESLAPSICKGDILFAGSGETKEDIGKAIVYQGDEKAFTGGDIIILRQVENDSLFLSYSLNSQYAKAFKAVESKGEIIVHIYASNLRELKIPLPPLEEQKAIAEYLDTQIEKIDLAICKIKSQINLIKEYKTTLISEAVCGRVGID